MPNPNVKTTPKVAPKVNKNSKAYTYINQVNIKRSTILKNGQLPTSPLYYPINYFKGLIRIFPGSDSQFALNICMTLLTRSRVQVLNNKYETIVHIKKTVERQVNTNFSIRPGSEKMIYTISQIIKAGESNLYETLPSNSFYHADVLQDTTEEFSKEYAIHGRNDMNAFLTTTTSNYNQKMTFNSF